MVTDAGTMKIAAGTNAGGIARWLRRPRRFLRSPKGYLMVALVALAALALPSAGGLGAAGIVLGWAVAGAAGMELVLVRLGDGRWRIPSSALLSGLITGMVLGPFEPWYTALIAGVIATNAKHLLRLGRGHLFNPAAFGLLAVFLLFGTGQSWWGALAELSVPMVAVLLTAGYLVADRANKLPAALSFLGAFVGLITLATFTGMGGEVQALFRPPFLQAALFFAFFMVTDPPTSPVPYRDQFWFGAAVAAAGAVAYLATRSEDFLLVGLLAGNLLYAAWRIVSRRRRRGQGPARVARAPR
jgi:Na+-translocating ferredoxin:NAD+ oxidoreductase RnfD subunit